MTTPHPPALDAAWGKIAARPIARLRFTLPGADPVTVVPTRGTLTHDAGRWPRTALTVTLPTTMTPTLTPPAITAYGGRVTVELGAEWGGVEHTFTAATLAVTGVTVDRPAATVTVTAASFEALVNEERKTSAVAGGYAVSMLVEGIASQPFGLDFPPMVNLLGALDVAVPDAYTYSGDVWPTVENLMDLAGGEAWFNADGVLVLRPVPVAGDPVLTIETGPGGTLTGYTSDRVWGPNKVDLRWVDPDDATVLGVWADDRPESATYIWGPYGRHTHVTTYNVDTGALPTQAVADAAAAAMARRVMGLLRSVTLRAVPAPWLIPGDTIGVGLLGEVAETHVVQSVTIPLPGLDVMTLTTRDSAYTGGPF